MHSLDNIDSFVGPILVLVLSKFLQLYELVLGVHSVLSMFGPEDLDILIIVQIILPLVVGIIPNLETRLGVLHLVLSLIC